DIPDWSFNSPYFEKDQSEYFIDAVKQSGLNLLVGTSVNLGSFTQQTISLDGSGRYLRGIFSSNGAYLQKSGFTFRYRFENNTLDKTLELDSFGVLYQPTRRRPN